MDRPEKRNSKKNPFCSLNHMFYIKDGKQTCHFVGHSKLKPIDYVALLNLQQHSAALTASIYPSTVAKRKKQSSTKSSTSVKNMSHEASGQIASVNELQENEHSFDVVSIEQAPFLFKKNI